MDARGEARCPSCTRLTTAEALDTTAPRELDVVAVSISPTVGATYPVLDGALDPLKLHPEAPSLERRVALQQLAWQLTQLATSVGMTAEDALHNTTYDPDPTITRWEAFRKELRVEFYKALRREVGHTEQGYTEVLISLPFVLPTAIAWRRRYSPDHTYGPMRALRWPYRYPGGLIRELALEGAVWLGVGGFAMLGFAWAYLAANTALWWSLTFWGLLTLGVSLGCAGALAGGIEN